MSRWISRFLFAVTFVFAAGIFAPAAFANTDGTPAEAKAMAIRAAELLRTKGADVAFPEFDKGAAFHDRDLYVMVYDPSGTCVAHGANAKLIGKDLINFQDTDGTYVIKNLVAVKDAGWINYRWAHPVTKKLTPKTTYVVHVGNYFVGVGAYKE
jgi:cytochrome c